MLSVSRWLVQKIQLQLRLQSYQPQPTTYHLPASSQRQQALEERSIAAERDTEILSRTLVAFTPLAFERGALVGEYLRQPFHHQRHERVGFLHRPARFVNEPGLDRIPLRAVARGFCAGKHRHRAIVGYVDAVALTVVSAMRVAWHRLACGGRCHRPRDVGSVWV